MTTKPADEWEGRHARITERWVALRDQVLKEWDEWSESSDDARQLRRIAEDLTGLSDEYVNTICCAGIGHHPEVIILRGPGSISVRRELPTLSRGQFGPAWSFLLSEAREVLRIVTEAA